jgi:hypothetical protein
MGNHIERGKQTAIDKAIYELLTTSNKLKINDGKQIREILMKLKEYEYYMISNAIGYGYERLWWDRDMQQNYYDNEYGKIQDTKEIGQAARERERKQERKRQTEEPDTGNDVGTLQSVCEGDEIKSNNSDRLGWSKSIGSQENEGATFNNGRLRSVLFQE